MRRRMTLLTLHPRCTESQIHKPNYHKTSNKEGKKKQAVNQKNKPFFLFFILELISACLLGILIKYYLYKKLIYIKNSRKVASHQLNADEYGRQFVDRDR